MHIHEARMLDVGVSGILLHALELFLVCCGLVMRPGHAGKGRTWCCR